MSGEFCVLCGRSDVPVVDGQCTDCFVKNHPLVRATQHPAVVICPTCGARRVGQVWEREGAPTLLSAEDLAPFLEPLDEVGIRRVDWDETGANPLVRELEGRVLVRFRGTERTVPVHLSVKIEHRTCTDCSRRVGHFYTAVIQLRTALDGPRETARELRERLEREFDRVLREARSDTKKALSWKEELPEGWNFFLTDTLAARALAKLAKERLGASVKESASLYGRKDGRDVYRVTLCVRLPAPGHLERTRVERQT